MKKKLLKYLEILIRKLEEIHFRISEKETEKLGYASLSPISNGDDDGQYSKALLWALENRKKQDIKNIVLTGPYGSGKSSILKTFQKNYKGTDLKFLPISLATLLLLASRQQPVKNGNLTPFKKAIPLLTIITNGNRQRTYFKSQHAL